MDHILFEQIRDKVKEVGVAEMINDKLIELHFIDHKKKMMSVFDDIKNLQYATTYEFYQFGDDYGIHEFLFCIAEGVPDVWTNTGGMAIKLVHNEDRDHIIWESPLDIRNAKVENVKSIRPWSKF